MASIKYNVFVGRQGDAFLTWATQFSLIVTVIVGVQSLFPVVIQRQSQNAHKRSLPYRVEDHVFVILRDPAQSQGQGFCLPLHPNRTRWASPEVHQATGSVARKGARGCTAGSIRNPLSL